MPKVSLTLAEMALAGEVAVMRRVKAIQVGRRHRHGMPPEEGFNRDFEGACGEMAVAKLTNRYWSGTVGVAAPGDVGDLEVRTTCRPDGCLLLHADDTDAAVFILLTSTSNSRICRKTFRPGDRSYHLKYHCKAVLQTRISLRCRSSFCTTSISSCSTSTEQIVHRRLP